VLLAALIFRREREITDTLVELLNSPVHRINARAEKKVTEHFVAEFTQVRGKSGLLGKIAAASLGRSEDSVRDVVYPAAAGERTLRDLVAGGVEEGGATPGGPWGRGRRTSGARAVRKTVGISTRPSAWGTWQRKRLATYKSPPSQVMWGGGC
jgi:hypothetical protein